MIGILRLLKQTQHRPQALRHAVLVNVDVKVGWVVERKSASSSRLHQIGNVVPPRHVGGPNHACRKKEDALHVVGAKNRKSNLIVVQVSVVERDQYAAAVPPFLYGALHKGQRLFQRYQRNLPLQAGNLIVEFVGSRGKNAGIEKVLVRIPNAMVSQHQQRIRRRQLRQNP